MKPERGPRVQLDLAQRQILIQHIHNTQLVQIEPHVRVERHAQRLRPQIDIFGPDQRPDARPLMTLLDLVPPAVDLVAHHGRLFDEESALRQESE